MSRAGLVLAGLVALAGAGCVERRMVLIEPNGAYGAVVYDEKDQPLGATPVDRSFTYYGKYRFRFVKDGYETRVIEERVKAPWYEWFPLDFVAENLIPWTIRDVRYISVELKPAQVVPPEALLQQGGVLRERGKVTGVPLPEAPQPRPLPEAPRPRPEGVPPLGSPSGVQVPVPTANAPGPGPGVISPQQPKSR